MAHHGQDALDRIGRDDVDVVVMDLRMPFRDSWSYWPHFAVTTYCYPLS